MKREPTQKMLNCMNWICESCIDFKKLPGYSSEIWTDFNKARIFISLNIVNTCDIEDIYNPKDFY